MPVFQLLDDPTGYVACDWDLTADPAGRDYWIAHFLEHYHTLAELIRAEYAPSDGRLEQFRREYLADIERLRQDPERFGPGGPHRGESRLPSPMTILTFDRIRDHHLRRFGFPDPFRHVKAKENEAALAVYPRLIAELDSQPPDRRLAELIHGVFAGNIFDLGAMATVRHYRDKGLDFFAVRSSLPPRPWLADDFDLIARRWSGSAWPYRKVLFFADNAGCDFVLGCLPLIREMAARRDADVVIAVNTGASLNDILLDEAEAVLADARRADPVLADALDAGRIRLVASGNSAPLINLADVSEELNRAAEGTDLLILEGMGRSVESNRLARFTVDTARLALLKDPRVAERIGGKVFDIYCRFEPAK